MLKREHIEDVVMVGGGPASLTAALYLGRARKRVLVVDRGQPRHAVSDGVHNVLTRDGMSPAVMREVAWSQMNAYPSVHHKSGVVVEMTYVDDLWHLVLASSEVIQARAVLVATGMVDQHPDVDGFEQRWGHSIHHCPYCHGWELRDKPWALMIHSEETIHMAPLLKGWSDDVVVLTNGLSLAEESLALLQHNGIGLYTANVESLHGPARALTHINLADGQVLQRQGLFVTSTQRQVPFVEQAGLSLNEQGYIDVNEMMQTSLPMVWAAGDVTSRFQQVTEASAQGARAAGSINMVLTMGMGAQW